MQEMDSLKPWVFLIDSLDQQMLHQAACLTSPSTLSATYGVSVELRLMTC